MEKNKILANVAILTAEQLFDEIKKGTVTLDELWKTTNLVPEKRNKIRNMQIELDSLDNDDWERARYGNEVSLYDYITKHPAGKYVVEAKQKIDFFEGQRSKAAADKEIILRNIHRNPNSYGSAEIIAFLKSHFTTGDLLNCGIPNSAIENLHNITIPKLELGPTPDSIPEGFTEVYFWGSTGSGKTCALGAVLQAAHQRGYLNIAQGTGYLYAHQLMNIFSDDGLANDYLPGPTPLENTQYLPFTLKRPNERSSRSVSLIELSGEIFKCFFDINAGRPLQSQAHIDTFDKLNSFLKNGNRKIHFFFVDYNRDNRPDGYGLTQSNYLSAASNYFNSHKIFGKSTDAIFIVLTKSDLLKDEEGNSISEAERVEYAIKYLNENRYASFINSLKAICQKEGINSGRLTVEPFSLGKVYFQEICDFDGSSAAKIVQLLMDRIPQSRRSILDILNK